MADIVDNKVEIKENSAYEVEIRATVIYVIDEIKRLLNNKINAIELNDYIWLMSKNKRLSKRPYHLQELTIINQNLESLSGFCRDFGGRSLNPCKYIN